MPILDEWLCVVWGLGRPKSGPFLLQMPETYWFEDLLSLSNPEKKRLKKK